MAIEELKGLECFNCKTRVFTKISNDTYKCKGCGHINYRSTDEDNIKYINACTAMENYHFSDAYNIYHNLYLQANESKFKAQAIFGMLKATYGIIYIESNYKLPDEDCKKKIPTFSNYDKVTQSLLDTKLYKEIKELNFDEKDKFLNEIKELDKDFKKIRKELDSDTIYDVFICVKISSLIDWRSKTNDYTSYAVDIYDKLTKDGLKVFCSEKNKVTGDAEIFAALAKSKVMLVISESKEHLESSWVQSEWRRWLNFIEIGKKDDYSLIALFPTDFMVPPTFEGKNINNRFKDTKDVYKKIDEICNRNEVKRKAGKVIIENGFSSNANSITNVDRIKYALDCAKDNHYQDSIDNLSKLEQNKFIDWIIEYNKSIIKKSKIVFDNNYYNNFDKMLKYCPNDLVKYFFKIIFYESKKLHDQNNDYLALGLLSLIIRYVDNNEINYEDLLSKINSKLFLLSDINVLNIYNERRLYENIDSEKFIEDITKIVNKDTKYSNNYIGALNELLNENVKYIEDKNKYYELIGDLFKDIRVFDFAIENYKKINSNSSNVYWKMFLCDMKAVDDNDFIKHNKSNKIRSNEYYVLADLYGNKNQKSKYKDTLDKQEKNLKSKRKNKRISLVISVISLIVICILSYSIFGPKVVYLDKDGQVLMKQTIWFSSDNIDSPTPPEVEGYVFKEWEELEKNQFQATYTLTIYFIEYNLGDFELMRDSFTVETLFDLPTPNKIGYTFLGWFDENDNLVNKLELKNYNLKAKWEEIIYTISYDLDGGICTNLPEEFTKLMALPIPTKEGYEFLGWFDENDNLVSALQLKNYNLKAKWEEIKYTISYDLNGGMCNNLPEEFSKSNIVSLPIPTNGRYIFLGWFDENDNLINTLELKNYNLKAKWTIVEVEDEYVYFGSYPQSEVTDTNLISELEHISNINGMNIVFKGNHYKVYDGKYYLVEPIKWRILEQNNNTYKLVSDVILDQSVFYEDWQNDRTINNNTIYPNNYEYSNIRAWLNGYDGTSYNVNSYQGVGFIDIAFTEEERKIINETLVDNSASTTYSQTNQYTCNNTLDKVYLLSYQDIVYKYFTSDDERQAKVTDYAKARGVYNDMINGYFWLRSPHGNISFSAYCVDYDGNVYCDYCCTSNTGARPALEITIK